MKKFSITNCLLLVLSVFLCLGTTFIFHACPIKDDGSWMRCHWAQIIVSAIGFSLAILALVRFFINSEKTVGSAFALITPQILIPLCQMKMMRCHTVTRPAVIINSAAIFVISLVDLILNSKNKNN